VAGVVRAVAQVRPDEVVGAFLASKLGNAESASSGQDNDRSNTYEVAGAAAAGPVAFLLADLPALGASGGLGHEEGGGEGGDESELHGCGVVMTWIVEGGAERL
jgi:hypothetical protein